MIVSIATIQFLTSLVDAPGDVGGVDLVEIRLRSNPAFMSGNKRGDALDYWFEAFSESLCGAFFCKTLTRCLPDAGTAILFPSTISFAVILRP